MSAGSRPTAIIVVDLNAQRGVCSNCNQPARVDNAHSCGAQVTGVAINTEYAVDPSLAQAIAVNDRLPAGMAFVGVGRVLRTDNGYRFERTKNPGDLR
ncbi:MAG TPA: hypothetical protein VJM46_00405 [Candidatus Saccharimonadales bacterium]|nr:hypothetical protein [Candidatus Saccharimonadales bacterium]